MKNTRVSYKLSNVSCFLLSLFTCCLDSLLFAAHFLLPFCVKAPLPLTMPYFETLRNRTVSTATPQPHFSVKESGNLQRSHKRWRGLQKQVSHTLCGENPCFSYSLKNKVCVIWQSLETGLTRFMVLTPGNSLTADSKLSLEGFYLEISPSLADLVLSLLFHLQTFTWLWTNSVVSRRP